MSSRKVVGASALFLLLTATPALLPQTAGQKVDTPEERRSLAQATMGARLRQMAAEGRPLLVMIVLAEQPQRRIVARHEVAARSSRESAERRYRESLSRPATRIAGQELRTAWDEVDAIELQTRRSAFEEIGRAIAPSQAVVQAALEQAGAKVLERYQAINMMAAEIPAPALDRIAQHPLIARIFPVESRHAQLNRSVPALGAPSFWDFGFTGAGQSVAVLDTGVRTNHPAFTAQDLTSQVFLNFGKRSDCFADDATSVEDRHGHGSHVSGIVASRGSADCTDCMGVARGLGRLYNLKIGYKTAACSDPKVGAGSSSTFDVLAALEWLVQNTPVRIVNFSFGSLAEADDDEFARSIDEFVDTYGLIFTVAAGNDGVNGLSSPGIAYNVITIANWAARGSISAGSSRGPTRGGRRKPDIAAPGSEIRSARYNWDDSGANDYVYMSGTSMAAPHIAGSAALLAHSGITDPLGIKAILINTTDDSAGGKLWETDRGWGYTNLARARTEPGVIAGQLTARPLPGHYALFRVRSPHGVRATVVWNRHIGARSAPAFNNIDLWAYGSASNLLLAGSNSDVDNVEKIQADAAGDDAVVKVKMRSQTLEGGSATERYAIAFSDANASKMSGPNLTLTCSPPATPVNPGASFAVGCRVVNTGDLAAFDAGGNFTLPSGFTGSTTLAFGNVLPGGASGEAQLALVAAVAPGAYEIRGTVTSVSYEESFSTTAAVVLTVASPPLGAPSNLAPVNGAAGVSLAPTLTWTGGSGATSHDVYFGTSSPPPFAANTPSTSYAPGNLSPGTTYYWSVAARNSSETRSSGVLSLTTQAGGPGPVLVASGLSRPSSLVADDSYIYWTDLGSASVRRVAKTGGPVTTLYTSADGYFTMGIAVDESKVYFGDWFSVKAVPKTGGAAVTLANSAVSRIAVDAGNVYWTHYWSGTVRKTPKTGGPITTLASGVNAPLGIRVRDNYVYWTEYADPGAVWKVPVSGGGATKVGDRSNSAGIDVDPSNVHWAVAGGDILSAAVAGGGVRTLVTGLQPPVTDVAIDASYALWVGGSSNGYLQQMRLGGGSVQTLASGLAFPAGLVTDACCVYWIEEAGGAPLTGSLKKIAKASLPPSPPVPQSPAGGAAGVSSSPALSWSAAAGATSYDVYLGTASTPPFITNTAATTHAPGTLIAGATYYWRIAARNASGATSSELRTFTVAQGASTVGTSPAGLSFSVDGTEYTAQQTFQWASGTVHSICTTSSQPGAAGTRYVWQNWSNSGALCHTIAVPAGGGAYTAIFRTQHQLTAAVTPSAGGSVTPASGTWFDANAAAVVTAAANNGYAFGSWSGGLTGATNPATLVMSGPRSVTANFLQTGTVIFFPTSATVAAAGAQGLVHISASPQTHAWSAASNVPWIAITAGSTGVGNGTVQYLVAENGSAAIRTGVLVIAGQNFQVTQQPNPAMTGLRLVPLAPCRIADTREAAGPFGGPSVSAGGVREFEIPAAGCGVPPSAAAYALNVTVVPSGPLGYVTVWPSRQTRPGASTLNSHDGRIKANAAIVAAGFGGAVSVYATDATHVVLDINGYFVPATEPAGLAFYPAAPCRVADTRAPLLGAPSLPAGSARAFPVRSGSCNVPSTARAYSLNVTVVPKTVLSYLTIWPAGQNRPTVSTLNAPTGAVTANAAIVPAGDGGAINTYVTEDTEVVIDINGYFAPPGAGGLSLYALPPCRVVDTRLPDGSPPRTGRIDVPAGGACQLPAAAQAYVFNATAVPPGPLGYLTLWPGGTTVMPVVSTLNAPDGMVTSNMAIVPAAGGGIGAYASNLTHLVLDAFGYFAP